MDLIDDSMAAVYQARRAESARKGQRCDCADPRCPFCRRPEPGTALRERLEAQELNRLAEPYEAELRAWAAEDEALREKGTA